MSHLITITIAGREFVRLFAADRRWRTDSNKYREGLHKTSVIYPVCHTKLFWSIDSFSEKIIAPAVKQLLTKVPENAIINPTPLAIPTLVTGTCETFESIGLRALEAYDIHTDAIVHRFDLRWRLP